MVIYFQEQKKNIVFNIKYKQTVIFPHLYDLITFYRGKYFNSLIQRQLGIRPKKSLKKSKFRPTFL